MRIIDFIPDANAPLRQSGDYDPQAPVVQLSSHSRYKQAVPDKIQGLTILGALLPFPNEPADTDDSPSVA